MIFLEKSPKTNQRLRRWELAILLGVAFAALVGPWLGARQDALARKVVRLHVVANSDSESDQALKLQVRDAVLDEAEPLLRGKDRAESLETLQNALPELGQAAADTVARAGYDYPVRLSVEDAWFPTKEYDDFALPAGTYTALRIELGEAKGKNWWCVVFPPLCLGSVTEQAAEAGFTEDELGLITGETEGYVIRFKVMEWWEEFKRLFD